MLRHLCALVIVTGCQTGLNYADTIEPRYVGVSPSGRVVPAKDTLRIVSFNVEFSKEVPRGIRVLRTSAQLRDADIVLLQEMTARAAKMIADSLDMHHVYYPAIYNRLARRDFGNAVLSRWPIVEDQKLILPARSRYAKTQRTATAATVRIGDNAVRIYSTHLGTPADLGWDGRVEQVTAIVNDAARHPRVIIGGDMNSEEIGRVVRDSGYLWPTDTIPRGNTFGRLDHVFLRGLTPLDSAGAGTVPIAPGISDHRPIWVRARLR